MFNKKNLAILLATLVGVESFTNTFTHTRSIKAFQTQNVVQGPFRLNSLAAEESIEAEKKKQSENPRNVEEDLTKIAYVVNLSYGV